MGKCTNCKGTGKQVFHGHFESVMGTCNFCKGSGKREDQLKWLDKLKYNKPAQRTQEAEPVIKVS